MPENVQESAKEAWEELSGLLKKFFRDHDLSLYSGTLQPAQDAAIAEYLDFLGLVDPDKGYSMLLRVPRLRCLCSRRQGRRCARASYGVHATHD